MKKYIKCIFIMLFCLLFIKVKAESTDTILLPGEEFNVKIKILAGNNTEPNGRRVVDENIISFKRSNTLLITPTDINIVSTPESIKPIYVWFDDGILYYYSENEKIYLNEDSSYLFYRLSKIENFDFESIDTSKVKYMKAMFTDDISLKELDLSTFNTSNVTNMSGMFSVNGSFTVNNVTYNYKSKSSLESINLSSFNTSNVTNMSYMFYGDTKLEQIIGLDKLNTSNVTNMVGMFYDCESLTELDLSKFDTGKVTNMSQMFNNCISLTSLDVSNWDVSKVTDFSRMFCGHSYVGDMKLIDLDVSKWDTSSAVDMTAMFYGLGSIEHLDVSNWDVSNVISFNHMFCDNNKLKSLDLSKWNVSNLKTTQNMFDDAFALATIGDISHWNTANVIDVNGMFNGCTSLEKNGKIDLSHWNTKNIKTTGEMFRAVPAKEIDLTGWDLSSITNESWEGAGTGIYYAAGNDSSYPGMSGMFLNMSNLEKVLVGDKFIMPEDVNVTKMFQGTSVTDFTRTYKVIYKDDTNDYIDYYENGETINFKSLEKEGYTLIGYKYNGTFYKLTDELIMPNNDIELIIVWAPPVIKTYTIDNNYIKGIELYKQANKLDLGIDNIYKIKIFDKNDNLKSDNYIGTSDKIKIYLDNELLSEYIVILKGDITGDGEISPLDYVKIKKHIMEESMIDGYEYLDAADYNSDDEISPLDYIMVKNYIMDGE